MTPITKKLVCDYLVVGAGAASMSFIDTLLTELPKSKVIMIDRKSSAGGHWVDSYGFVQLHQPSLLYGVESKQLEGNWMLPWKHRANKSEILTYFNAFVKEKQEAGQLEFYPNCNYNFGHEDTNPDGLYSFSSLDGQQKYDVQVDVKLVDGTAGECIIPSQNPLPFPVDVGAQIMTPNQIYDASFDRKHRSDLARKTKCFVVVGAGKTAMDTVVYLQRVMKTKPSNIAWVIPNDVWMLNRDGGGNPWVWPKALLENNLDSDQAALSLEEKGMFYRLDPNILPTQFRFPVVEAGELNLMRKVKTIIRRGRATGIRVTGDDDRKTVTMDFGDNKPAWEVPGVDANECVFVHCASPGPFNNKVVDSVFESDKKLTLTLLVAPPISQSMSNIAKIEAARRKGTLDLDFGRQLLAASETNDTAEETNLADKYSENDVLRALIVGYKLKTGGKLAPLDPIFTLASFFAILDADPMTAYDWQKGSRLQFLSIPGFKIQIYEDVLELARKGKQELGYTDEKVRTFEMLADKLKPLEGM
jgi:hypothetical protein